MRRGDQVAAPYSAPVFGDGVFPLTLSPPSAIIALKPQVEAKPRQGEDMKTTEKSMVEIVSKFEFLGDFQFFITSDAIETSSGFDTMYCLFDRLGNYMCSPLRLHNYSGSIIQPMCSLLINAKMPVVMVTSIAQILFGGTHKDKESLFVTVQRVNRGEGSRKLMDKVFSLVDAHGQVLSRITVEASQRIGSRGIEICLLRRAGRAEDDVADPSHWVFYPENHEVRDPALPKRAIRAA